MRFDGADGADAAFSLTFDGGLPEHVELVFPLLEEYRVKSTFFVTAPALLGNPAGWRKVADAGHEIGSHSFLGVTNRGELPAWTLEMVREDLRMTEKAIAEICEAAVSSFALPGEETQCAEGDYLPVLKKFYTQIRSPLSHPNQGLETDLTHIGSLYWRDLMGPADALLPDVGQWNVVVFENFFGPDFLAAETDLRALLEELKKRSNIYVATMGNIGEAINESRTSYPKFTR